MAQNNFGDIVGSMLSGFATGDPNSFMKQQQLQNNFLLNLQKMKMEEEELGLRKQESSTRNKLLEMQLKKAMDENEWGNAPVGDLFTPETQTTSRMPQVPEGEEEGAYTVEEKPTGKMGLNFGRLSSMPMGKFEKVASGVKSLKDILSPPESKAIKVDGGIYKDGQFIESPFSKTTKAQSDMGKFASDLGIDLKSLTEEGVNKVGEVWQKMHGKDKDKLSTTTSYDEKGNGFAHIINLETKKVETIPLGPVGKPGKTGTDVNIKVGEKGMEQVAKTMGEEIVKERKDVEKAYGSLRQLQDVKGLLRSGVITGTGANFIVALGKGLQQAGFNIGKDEISNTEAFAATMGNQTAQIIKQFGAGTGLSDADRDYAEKIAAGKITLNKDSIQKIIKLNEKGLRNVVQNFNKRAESVMGKPEAGSLPYDLRIEVDPMLMKDSLELETYKANGKTYQIPVDELDDFKKAFPKAERVF